MKYWPTCRCVECLKIHFSFSEKASDFRDRLILGELLYTLLLVGVTIIPLHACMQIPEHGRQNCILKQQVISELCAAIAMLKCISI